jgi:hypothetical protein
VLCSNALSDLVALWKAALLLCSTTLFTAIAITHSFKHATQSLHSLDFALNCETPLTINRPKNLIRPKPPGQSITMFSAIFSAALLAGAVVAQSPGDAVVINKCEYQVYLNNTPAADGGYSTIDRVLQPDDSYTQQWTELSNGNGWSIKLSKTAVLDNILQYEYTFHNDGNIWYDLSEVNGNPWDGNWEITAESPDDSCAPKQQAYRYATDDAYGMQACKQDATITITLCSGESQNDGGAASASSSVAAETSTEAAASSPSAWSSATSAAPESTPASEPSTASPETTSEAPAPASTATTTSRQWGHHSWHQADAVVTPTTLATLTTSSAVVTSQGAAVTVTEVDTAVVTEIVTAYGRHRRHLHAHARA